MFGKQIGIDLIRFGSRGTAVSIDGFGIDRIDRVSRLKEPGDQEAVISFDNANHLLFPIRAGDRKQKIFQVLKSFRGMGDTQRSNLLACISNDTDIMIG
jgi:hypothetical protein